MLSILVSNSGLTDRQVVDLCSDELGPLKIDETVYVSAGKGRVRRAMKVVAVDVEAGTVTLVPDDSVEPDDASAESGDDRSPETEVFYLSDVIAPGAVTCTPYQIQAAKIHTAKYFAGAHVTPTLTRAGGIDPDRASFVAEFLRRKDVVELVEGSLANSRSGVKYRLKQRRWRLWHRLIENMEENGLRPVAWSYFWGLTKSKEYELLTADNCCCATCRDLGFVNFQELRDIATSVCGHLEVLSAGRVPAHLPALLVRIEKEEQFRRTIFQTHLLAESGVGTHCRTLLLSAGVDRRFM